LDPKDAPNKKTNLWDKVPDLDLPISEVEDLFENKKKPMTSAVANSKVVNVPKKKSCLDPKVAQSIAIAVSRLPKPEEIRNAIKNLDKRTMAQEQIQMLIRIYPPAEEITTLLEEDKEKDPEDKWDKAEEFMLNLLSASDTSSLLIKQKLQVWEISLWWPEKRVVMENTLNNFEKAYDTLMDCPVFKKVLGFTLAIGNVLNGGTNKGRADGFYLDAISKTTTLKASDGNTILQYIMKKLKTEDPEVVNFKETLEPIYSIQGYTLKDVTSQLSEIDGTVKKACSLFATVQSRSEEGEIYVQEMSDFVTKASKKMEEFQKKLEKLKATHLEACNFFLFSKGDEKIEDTEEFFKFFTNFFEQMYKSLPKEEKKKKAAAKAGEKKLGGKVGVTQGLASAS